LSRRGEESEFHGWVGEEAPLHLGEPEMLMDVIQARWRFEDADGFDPDDSPENKQ
jgi:hypothetical protein